MTLKVVGAGLGRTGTHSLKIALERLLGAPCYHMIEVFSHPDHVCHWQDAAEGRPVEWPNVLNGYAAAVDWPAAQYYADLAAQYPDALVLLSVRDAQRWWDSASATIFSTVNASGLADQRPETFKMIRTMLQNGFTPDIADRDACIAAFEHHNEEVKRTIPADRLLVWTASDGWGPICQALGLPIPDEPFPVTNTREEFIKRRQPEDLDATEAHAADQS